MCYFKTNAITIHLKSKIFNIILKKKMAVSPVGWGYRIPYLPTPLLGQDMTQGQFLSRV